MAQEFVVCRSIRDVAAMLDAVSSPAPGDPFVIIQPRRPYLHEVGAPSGKPRIAFTTNPWLPFPIDPEIVAVVEKAAEKCEDLGFQVEEATPVYDHEELMRAATIVWAIGFDVGVDSLAALMNRAVNRDTLEARYSGFL